MSDEVKTVIVKQDPDADFGVRLHGDGDKPALQHQHQVLGQVLHGSSSQQPLVHMVCWEEEQTCRVEVEGRVVLAGDEEAPIQVRMGHDFGNVHRQEHEVAPLDHAVKMETKLSEPIHHALQMRTPLQLRFCNPWHIASDYILRLTWRDSEVGSIRLTGATVATPQPCADDACPPPTALPTHP